jgi:hypothetical protein
MLRRFEQKFELSRAGPGSIGQQPRQPVPAEVVPQCSAVAEESDR